MRQIWYRLQSKNGCIDMMFTDFDSMLRFYKQLTLQYTDCTWSIEEVEV